MQNGAEVSLKLLPNVVNDSNVASRRLGPLLKNGLSLIRNVLKLLDKSVLISLLLTTAVSATDASIHKKMFASGNTTWIISNDETNNIMKLIKSLEESVLLINNQNNRIKQLAEI